MNNNPVPAIRDPGFWAPRTCFLEPAPEILRAAELLDQAVSAHLAGSFSKAGRLIAEADIPEVRGWVYSIVSGENPGIHRRRAVKGVPLTLDKNERDRRRMAGKHQERALIARDGYRCRFCGIPLIDRDVRVAMHCHYPDELPWGSTNDSCHAAFLCMWVQYDHVLPHSRGGITDLDNLVITCGPCNFGRGEWTLEEVGLIDPRSRRVEPTAWDGLERFIVH